MKLTDEALDAQLRLYDWHDSRNPSPTVAYEAMAELNREKYGTSHALLDNAPDGLQHTLRSALGLGETFAVTSEMCEVLNRARRDIPPYALSPVDVPCPTGFVYFADGFPFMDLKGNTVVLKAFSWAPVRQVGVTLDDKLAHLRLEIGGGDDIDWTEGNGIWLATWTDMEDRRDSYYDQRPPPGSGIPPILYLSDTVWYFGETNDRNIDATIDKFHDLLDDEVWEEYRADAPMLVLGTFFRLIQEPFISTYRERASRGTQRRIDRSDLTAHEDGIKIITLRRALTKKGDDGEERDDPYYNVQFVVRGHWRMQWYPSQKRHAPKWIAPYWKGPEGAPIVEHDHVFHWKR